MRPVLGPGAGRPRIADLSAQASWARVLHFENRVDGLPQSRRGVTGSREDQPAGAGGQKDVEDDRCRKRTG
ncbi:hypothetical protein MGAD_38930 [Mycolicibacterium gadium]|uniref:Uncharacterized protein n=1 Tax=Mycolicibacterium gadium TaxID=1794 RepID=A0A7I7WUL1_MYCGU|nr:hypothetical protein MGAD_38930 [Mycolicibacterium gadium]